MKPVKLLIFTVLISTVISVHAETLVGELPGEFTVNNLGAASYTVPLTVSPGTAGVEPKLSISYSSRGDNGLLGLGFSLGGLSTISRGGASLDQDGFIDGVDFDDNDRFLLDGKRLEIVALNGSPTTNKAFYGDANTEYRTEIDSFSRVEAFGQAGNGPAWFRVWTKSGLIYEYGNTADSAFKPGSHSSVLSWAVNKISDTAGNYMTFTYEETSSGSQISHIDYTGNTNVTLNPYNSVEFVYENRPDEKLSFFKGVEMEQTKRLSKIVMKHDGSYLHDYRLSYTVNEAGQSIVQSLQQFFGEGAGADCLPETRFEYSGISAGTNFAYTIGTNFLQSGLNVRSDSSSILCGDFNGDGLTDIVSAGSYENTCWVGLSNGDGTFEFTSGTNFLVGVEHRSDQDICLSGDFNGDGLTDLASVGHEEGRWVGLSNGDGTFEFTSGTNFLAAGIDDYLLTSDKCSVADFNADGLSDLLAVSGYGTNRCWIGLSNGDGTFEFTIGNTFFPEDIPARTDIGRFLNGDFNGDGLADMLALSYYRPEHHWIALNSNEKARVTQVTQGYQDATHHGVVTEMDYLPITDSDIYIKGSGADYPIRDIISPMHVVSRMTKDNGQDGEYRTDYAYRSARYHAHGRGFLGFQQFISYDFETDICYAETLAHEFPLTGRPTRTETFYIPDPDGDPGDPGYKQLIKLVENEWTYDLVDGGTLFALNPKSTETKWELGNTNTPISVVSTWNWFDEQDTTQLPRMGNPTTFYSEIVYGDLSQNIIDYGGGLEQTTENSYSNLVDSTHWLLGRLQASGVRHQASGRSDIVRSSSFDYYAVSGLLSQETIEPGDPDFELVTDYFYDDFGNIDRKELSGAGISNRVVQYSDYDAKGRFVEETQNALGHETTFVFDQALGRPLSSTDPNGLTTEWEYDQTGRLIYEERPDGTVTTNEYIWDFSTTVSVPAGPGSGSSISQKAAYKLHTETDGAPPVTTWFDKQGREIKTRTQSADGRDVFVLKGYNSIAQPIAVSEPFFSGDTPLYTFTEYDGLGRAQYVTAPDGTVSEQVYEGLTTKAIKDSDHRTAGAKHQVHTTVKNAKGEVLNVTDAMSNTVTFVYDPVGNLIQTTDPATNVTQIGYDIRGNKISQDDPDMGEWTYEYNALDQLISQTDANGNIIQTSYDVLGRATARTNWVVTVTNGLVLESTAAWFYDGSTEGDRLGMLRLEEHRDGTGSLINRKRYAYDEYSRPMLELMNYDQKWYYTALEYDAFSRVEKVHRYWRPKGKEGIDSNLDPQWNTFVSINTYNQYGALLEVSDGDSHTWWETSESDYDAQGRVTLHTYGNGLVTTNTFNPLTGRTTGIGISDFQSQVSNFQFQYDRIGNLTQRAQSRPLMTTLTETCTYDSLNRLLTTSTASTNSTVVYDALGNIISRTGVGSYLYGTKPHAVSSAGDCDYFYDANGNIVRRDRDSQYEFTARWNSFNKPVSLFSGLDGSEFSYSVDGRRTKQIIFEDLTNVTKKVYATPAYEMKETLLNPAETNRANWQWEMEHCRIYVDTPVGKIGIYQEDGNTNGTGSVTRSYMHKDHLGSIVAISDDATNVTFMSFDAWGNRRNPADWSPQGAGVGSQASEWTDRGFTGHEQLDHLDLIHMNGRIYDNAIGRFISPDPLIQAPENLQSFNRYSYVWNNPLSKTDPSGFKAKMTKARDNGGKGKYENYAEPISSGTLSENDSINTQSEGQDVDVDTQYTEAEYDDYGNETSSASETTTITVSSGATSTEEKIGQGSGAGASNDIGPKGNGLNEGGGSGKLEQPNSNSTGATADGAGKGGVDGGSVQNKTPGSVGDSTKSGTVGGHKNFENPGGGKNQGGTGDKKTPATNQTKPSDTMNVAIKITITSKQKHLFHPEGSVTGSYPQSATSGHQSPWEVTSRDIETKEVPGSWVSTDKTVDITTKAVDVGWYVGDIEKTETITYEYGPADQQQ